MLSRPRALDLFCGAGGASLGLFRAGFDVWGVDIKPQPNYPFRFIQDDALRFPFFGKKSTVKFDLVWASPPCQAYTKAQRIRNNNHQDLIGEIREKLQKWQQQGEYWVIENVPSSPLRHPIELCGTMFGLGTYRHRWFESSLPLEQPPHKKHTTKTTKMGRKPVSGEFIHVVGNFSGVRKARSAMGIGWMTRDELKEAVPPAYSEYIGSRIYEYALAA